MCSVASSSLVVTRNVALSVASCCKSMVLLNCLLQWLMQYSIISFHCNCVFVFRALTSLWISMDCPATTFSTKTIFMYSHMSLNFHAFQLAWQRFLLHCHSDFSFVSVTLCYNGLSCENTRELIHYPRLKRRLGSRLKPYRSASMSILPT